jgi:hypothetical protein
MRKKIMFNRSEVHENEIFRFQFCGLTIEEAARLCCVPVSTVTSWDQGKRIPPLCKRVMALYSGRDLEFPGWQGWSISPNKLTMPSGDSVTPRMIEKWFTLYGVSYRRIRNPVRARLNQIRYFR